MPEADIPRTLIIETAASACSVALIEGSAVIADCHEVVGRGHAERLIPMIAELPDGGRAARILVDCGPGSFTGIRVGIAAARGLALGWGVPVAGFSSLPLVAASGFAAQAELRELAVVLEGGHGEVFMQAFSRDGGTIGSFASLKPDVALAQLHGRAAIGNGVRHLMALDPDVTASETLPRAADAALLNADLQTLPASPIYGRPPDAKPLAQ